MQDHHNFPRDWLKFEVSLELVKHTPAVVLAAPVMYVWAIQQLAVPRPGISLDTPVPLHEYV